jgi:hypothetical protein
MCDARHETAPPDLQPAKSRRLDEFRLKQSGHTHNDRRAYMTPRLLPDEIE